MSCANKLTAEAFAVLLAATAACISAGAWHWSGNVVSEEACSAKVVALTFDDGPHPKKTPEILEILDKYDVHATFFAVGENAEAHPEIVKAEIDAGHEIGNHTYTHVFLKNADCEKVKREICAFDDYMLEEFEYKPKLLRPPGGLYNDSVCTFAESMGYSVILWSVDTRDWAHTSAGAIADTILDNVSGGDIILCHDFIGGEAHTAQALRTVIPQLKNMGYEFVTVSELMALSEK